MDFGSALRTVAGFLEERGYRYAVIGGVALAAYGLPRTTEDLDFVVEARGQDELIGFLESLGYRTLHRSSGYSNHLHPDPDRGGIDFVYVRGETGDKLFSESRTSRGPEDIQIPLPKPEHLAALKVQAMKNDPARTFRDMADIGFLLLLPGVDRREVQAYFERHGMEDRFDELAESL